MRYGARFVEYTRRGQGISDLEDEHSTDVNATRKNKVAYVNLTLKGSVKLNCEEEGVKINGG